MKGDIQDCIISCWLQQSNDKKCTVDCIHTKLGLSDDCATCWYDEGSCTVQNCAGVCLNPKSAACKACSKAKCFPQCVQCSGVPMWAFPP